MASGSSKADGSCVRSRTCASRSRISTRSQPGAVRGVGSDSTLVGGAVFGLGAYVIPSLHLAAWSFTGGAKG